MKKPTKIKKLKGNILMCKTIFLIFTVYLFSSLTYAACDATACTSKIASLYVTVGGNVYIQHSDSPDGELGCTLASSTT